MSRRSTLPPHPPPLSHPLTQLKSIHSLLFIILSLFIFIFIYLGGQLCPHPPPVSHSPTQLKSIHSLLFIILSLFIFIIISRRSTLPPPLSIKIPFQLKSIHSSTQNWSLTKEPFHTNTILSFHSRPSL